MRSPVTGIAALLVLLLVAIVGYMSLFTVQQTEQTIVLQFGRPVDVVTDPGLHFNTTMNDWHTCKASGDIRASNPCSEYMFLDDTACNLA